MARPAAAWVFASTKRVAPAGKVVPGATPGERATVNAGAEVSETTTFTIDDVAATVSESVARAVT